MVINIFNALEELHIKRDFVLQIGEQRRDFLLRLRDYGRLVCAHQCIENARNTV